MTELEGLFAGLDADGSGELSLDEFMDGMKDVEIKKRLEKLHLSVDEAQKLFGLLDSEEDGSITIQEFISGVMKLQGKVIKPMHLVELQYELERALREMMNSDEGQKYRGLKPREVRVAPAAASRALPPPAQAQGGGGGAQQTGGVLAPVELAPGPAPGPGSAPGASGQQSLGTEKGDPAMEERLRCLEREVWARDLELQSFKERVYRRARDGRANVEAIARSQDELLQRLGQTAPKRPEFWPLKPAAELAPNAPPIHGKLLDYHV